MQCEHRGPNVLSSMHVLAPHLSMLAWGLHNCWGPLVHVKKPDCIVLQGFCVNADRNASALLSTLWGWTPVHLAPGGAVADQRSCHDSPAALLLSTRGSSALQGQPWVSVREAGAGGDGERPKLETVGRRSSAAPATWTLRATTVVRVRFPSICLTTLDRWSSGLGLTDQSDAFLELIAVPLHRMLRLHQKVRLSQLWGKSWGDSYLIFSHSYLL